MFCAMFVSLERQGMYPAQFDGIVHCAMSFCIITQCFYLYIKASNLFSKTTSVIIFCSFAEIKNHDVCLTFSLNAYFVHAGRLVSMFLISPFCRCQVGLQEVPKDSALGRLRGSDNVVCYIFLFLVPSLSYATSLSAAFFFRKGGM